MAFSPPSAQYMPPHARHRPRPLFKYGVSPKCAAHNDAVLWSFDYDLAAVLKAKRFSTAGYSSKFRTIAHLKPLLHHHKHRPHLKTQLSKGATYPSMNINEQRCKALFLLRALQKGNHKPARDDLDACAKLYFCDVTLGYPILLPASAATRLKRVEVYSVSIMYQPKTQPDSSVKEN